MLPPCPHLPDADLSLSAVSIRAAGEDRGETFYRLALTCAQALWQKEMPAQAILMINRAFSADLAGRETILIEWHPPYRALRWILEHRVEDHFIGNPRRHFQHLATRMCGPRAEVRTWRAWACWHIACLVDPNDPASLDAVYRKVDAKKKTVSKNLVGKTYENHLGSGLIATVESGKENNFKFEVKSK